MGCFIAGVLQKEVDTEEGLGSVVVVPQNWNQDDETQSTTGEFKSCTVHAAWLYFLKPSMNEKVSKK